MRLILKSFALTVCAVFVVTSLSLAGSSLRLNPQKAASGEMVSIPLMLQSDTQLSALSVDVFFPADQLQFEYAEIGTAALSKRVVSTVREQGRLRLGLLSMDQSLIENGEVAVLTFSVDHEVETGTIRIDQQAMGAGPDGAEVKVAGKPGSIQVGY